MLAVPACTGTFSSSFLERISSFFHVFVSEEISTGRRSIRVKRPSSVLSVSMRSPIVNEESVISAESTSTYAFPRRLIGAV